MHIPKYRIVDVVKLAKELGNYHVVADEDGKDDLVDELYSYLSTPYDAYAFVHMEDHIRHPEDDDWDEIPESVKQAYDYLIAMYGFQRGECFLWYFSE